MVLELLPIVTFGSAKFEREELGQHVRDIARGISGIYNALKMGLYRYIHEAATLAILYVLGVKRQSLVMSKFSKN